MSVQGYTDRATSFPMRIEEPRIIEQYRVRAYHDRHILRPHLMHELLRLRRRYRQGTIQMLSGNP